MSDWLHTIYYCLDCGELSVYVEPGEGDYYMGRTYICIKCGNEWSLPYEPRQCGSFGMASKKAKLDELRKNEKA